VKEKKGKPLELVGPVTPKNPFMDTFWLVSSFTYSFWAHAFMLTQLSVYIHVFFYSHLLALKRYALRRPTPYTYTIHQINNDHFLSFYDSALGEMALVDNVFLAGNPPSGASRLMMMQVKFRNLRALKKYIAMDTTLLHAKKSRVLCR